MDERARRISQAIEKSGLSYPELEKMTGVSKSSLQRYATGVTKKIPIDCIEKIAEATQTSARYLMGWDDTSELTATDRAPQADAPDPDNWQALRSVLEQLPDEKLDEVLAYAEYLAEKGKKNASE